MVILVVPICVACNFYLFDELCVHGFRQLWGPGDPWQTRRAPRHLASRLLQPLCHSGLSNRPIRQENGLQDEDRRALTPLFHGHINPYGQFALDLAQPSFLDAA